MARLTIESTDVSSAGANFCSTATMRADAASCAAVSPAGTLAPKLVVCSRTRMCPTAFALAESGSFTSGTHSSRATPCATPNTATFVAHMTSSSSTSSSITVTVTTSFAGSHTSSVNVSLYDGARLPLIVFVRTVCFASCRTTYGSPLSNVPARGRSRHAHTVNDSRNVPGSGPCRTTSAFIIASQSAWSSSVVSTASVGPAPGYRCRIFSSRRR